MRVEGLREVQAALDGLTGRQRQNIERKAARASMGALKRVLQLDWRTLPVKEKTPGGAKRSIRRATAKALTVKVGTGRGKSRVMGGNIDLSRGVYGRVFVNYAKKNAGPARMAHFLARGHSVPDGWAAGYFPTARRFRTSSGRFRNMYMRAVLAWVHSPKMTQKQARSFLS